MIITKLLLSISITALFINQIVIILEKEKLEKEIRIIMKIMNGEPLTRKEKKHAGKYENRNQEIGKISRDLKKAGDGLECSYFMFVAT